MKEIKKAIIAVAGYGTRRLPLTKAVEKSMLPIGDRPLVDYAVSECVAAGIKDIYFVINRTLGEQTQIETYYGENKLLTEFLTARQATAKLAKLQTAPEDVRFHYIVQDPNAQYGTAVPVALFMQECGATLAADERVIFANGDDFFWDGGKTSEMAEFIKAAPAGEAAVIGVKYPRETAGCYGVIDQQAGYMTNLVEKPAPGAIKESQVVDGMVLANINRFILSPALLQEMVDYVQQHDFSPLDQEYLITDPIQSFVKKGGKVCVVAAKSEWLDGGSLEGWYKANQVVLGQA